MSHIARLILAIFIFNSCDGRKVKSNINIYQNNDTCEIEDDNLNIFLESVDLVLFEKSQSCLLVPVNSRGDRKTLEKIKKNINELGLDFLFQDGADSILVIEYKLHKDNDLDIISKVDFVPVYKGEVELTFHDVLYKLRVERLFAGP